MENKDLILVDGALTEFNRVSAGLALLEKNYKGMLYETDTEIGLMHAKAARKAVRDPRLEVEKIRKAAKAPLLAVGRTLDAEANRITLELLALENPIDQQIKEQEQRVERERLARLEAERLRVVAITTKLNDIRGLVTIFSNQSPVAIAGAIETLTHLPIDDSFQEFRPQADDAKVATLAKLAELHTAAIDREAERERIAAERAELARRRAEDDRLARERAETDRIARERQDQLNREAEQQRRANADEAGRLAAERAEFERKVARSAPVSKPAPVVESLSTVVKAKPRLTAKPRPAAGEIICVIATHFGVTSDTARHWLTELQGELTV